MCMEEIAQQLIKIDARLTHIEEVLLRLDSNSKVVEKDCEKMREHIEFVEDAYQVVRTPLNYLKSRVDYIMGSNTMTELPMLE